MVYFTILYMKNSVFSNIWMITMSVTIILFHLGKFSIVDEILEAVFVTEEHLPSFEPDV